MLSASLSASSIVFFPFVALFWKYLPKGRHNSLAGFVRILEKMENTEIWLLECQALHINYIILSTVLKNTGIRAHFPVFGPKWPHVSVWPQMSPCACSSPNGPMCVFVPKWPHVCVWPQMALCAHLAQNGPMCVFGPKWPHVRAWSIWPHVRVWPQMAPNYPMRVFGPKWPHVRVWPPMATCACHL